MPAAPFSIVAAVCALPDEPGLRTGLTDALRRLVGPKLCREEQRHLRRFADGRQQSAHWLARGLAAVLCNGLAAPETLLGALRRDARGRPFFAEDLPGAWLASFSCSSTAAACALGQWAPAGDGVLSMQTAGLGVDLEDTDETPPARRAFSEEEWRIVQLAGGREALRRWTIKEAALKAWGLGLVRNPAALHAGRGGARRGMMRDCAATPLYWRCFALPGRWCALAASAPFRLRGRCWTAGELLRTLAAGEHAAQRFRDARDAAERIDDQIFQI